MCHTNGVGILQKLHLAKVYVIVGFADKIALSTKKLKTDALKNRFFSTYFS